MITVLAAIAALAAGPIAKFDARPPLAEYQSTAKLEDAERCLIDLAQAPAPSVYRQPDRPNDVMLLWFKTADGGGVALWRIDLHRGGNGTHVKSWMPLKQAAECTPTAG